MTYITQPNLEAKLGRTLTANESSYFTSVLAPSIDAYIDKQTGTTFGGSTPSTIYVDGNDEELVVIPTMHTITEVKQDEVIMAVNTYSLYPRGAVDSLAIRNTADWNKGDENISVTGVLGYTVIPADIKLAALELATNSMTEIVNGYKSESVGDWSVSYDNSIKGITPQSLGILEGYARLSRRM